MSETGKCGECEAAISYETGFTFAHDGLFCTTCRPVKDGYTLSDLQRMKEENQVARAAYETSLMDLVGPDVYFAIKASGQE